MRRIVALICVSIVLIVFYLLLLLGSVFSWYNPLLYNITHKETSYTFNLIKNFGGFWSANVSKIISAILPITATVPYGQVYAGFEMHEVGIGNNRYWYFFISNDLQNMPIIGDYVSNVIALPNLGREYTGAIYYSAQWLISSPINDTNYYHPYGIVITGVTTSPGYYQINSQCLYNPSSCGLDSVPQVIISYSPSACSKESGVVEPNIRPLNDELGSCSRTVSVYTMSSNVAINGLANIGVAGRYVISRPLIGISTSHIGSLGLVIGVNNLFVFKSPDDPKAGYDYEIYEPAETAFYSYINITKQSGYYDVPTIFIPALYRDLDKISLWITSSDRIQFGIHSALHYVGDFIPYWLINKITAPYIIPLFYIMHLNDPNIIQQTGSSYSIYMPVMFVDNGKIVILDTEIVGYQLYPLTSSDKLFWLTGPGIGAKRYVFNVQSVRISPYAKVYYLTTSLNEYYLVNIGENISLLVLDPYTAKLQIINLRGVKLVDNPSNITRKTVNISSVNVRVYDISSIGAFADLDNLYIDPTYINSGYIILYKNNYYRNDNLTNELYVLDLNSSTITKYVYNDSFMFRYQVNIPPNANMYTKVLSSNGIQGMGYPQLVIGEFAEFSNSVYVNYYRYKPVFDIRANVSLNASLAQAYTLTVLPVSITYYANGGATTANNVVVRINITDSSVLSSIGTIDARDIRVFTSDTYGQDYYRENGLTYAIEDYKRGRYLTLLVLVPQLSSNTTTTLYIYMGYPYARYIAVDPNWLKANYPVLELKT